MFFPFNEVVMLVILFFSFLLTLLLLEILFKHVIWAFLGWYGLLDLLFEIIQVFGLAVSLLVIGNGYFDLHRASFIRELQAVAQEIKKYLLIPPCIPKYRLNQVQVDVLVDLSCKRDALWLGAWRQYLEGFKDGGAQVEILFVKGELVVFKLCQVK